MSTKVLVLFFVSVLNLILSLLIFIRNPRNKINIFYSIATAGLAWWGISEGSTLLGKTAFSVWLSSAMTYAAGAFIAANFLIFSFYFPFISYKLSKKLILGIYILFLIIGIMSLTPGWVVKEGVVREDSNSFVVNTYGSIIYLIYFLGFFGWGFYNLIGKYKRSGGFIKKQLEYVIIGVLISLIISVITNLIIPMFRGTWLGWCGPTSTLIIILFISYLLFFPGRKIYIK